MRSRSPDIFNDVMARLDRAIQRAHVHARNEPYARLDGPLLRATTV
jgi:hypothetical protein